MQASKINVNEIYAIRHEGELVRFWVKEVVTRRYRNTGSPHDFSSTVVGEIREPGREKELTLDPKALLGPYEEQVELKERAEAEKREREARENEHAERTAALWRELHRITGLPIPNDPRSYKNPIRAMSGYDITISREAVQPLLDALKRRGA